MCGVVRAWGRWGKCSPSELPPEVTALQLREGTCCCTWGGKRKGKLMECQCQNWNLQARGRCVWGAGAARCCLRWSNFCCYFRMEKSEILKPLQRNCKGKKSGYRGGGQSRRKVLIAVSTQVWTLDFLRKIVLLKPQCFFSLLCSCSSLPGRKFFFRIIRVSDMCEQFVSQHLQLRGAGCQRFAGGNWAQPGLRVVVTAAHPIMRMSGQGWRGEAGNSRNNPGSGVMKYQLCVGRDGKAQRYLRKGWDLLPWEIPKAHGGKGVCAKGGAGGTKCLGLGFFVLLLHLTLFLLI